MVNIKVTPFALPQAQVMRLVCALGEELASPMAVTRYEPPHGREKTAESPPATFPVATVSPLLFLITMSKYFSLQGHTVKSSSTVTATLHLLLDMSANYIQSFRTAEFC